MRTAYLVGNGCSPGPRTSRLRFGRRCAGSRSPSNAPAAAPAALTRRGVVGGVVTVDPVDAVVPAHHQLQLPVGDLGRAHELRVPGRCAPLVVDECRGRREARERHVRRRIRRHGHRVDRDLESAPLQLARRRQARRSAPDHSDPALARLLRHLGHHDAAAPAERHAGAGMAVVVDEWFSSRMARREGRIPSRGAAAIRPSSESRDPRTREPARD